jgi:HSP20 family protein
MAKRKSNNASGKTANKTENKSAHLQRVGEENLERLRATPFSLMRRFSEEMDRMYEEFGLGRGWLTPALDRTGLPQGSWTPQVEMFERDNELVVRADLPGMTKDDVKVEFDDEGITIEGERKHEREEKGEGYYRSERTYGKFFRRIPVPESVDPEDAEASFNDGVLEITMPAPARRGRKTRRLDIGGQAAPKARGKAA